MIIPPHLKLTSAEGNLSSTSGLGEFASEGGFCSTKSRHDDGVEALKINGDLNWMEAAISTFLVSSFNSIRTFGGF